MDNEFPNQVAGQCVTSSHDEMQSSSSASIPTPTPWCEGKSRSLEKDTKETVDLAPIYEDMTSKAEPSVEETREMESTSGGEPSTSTGANSNSVEIKASTNMSEKNHEVATISTSGEHEREESLVTATTLSPSTSSKLEPPHRTSTPSPPPPPLDPDSTLDSTLSSLSTPALPSVVTNADADAGVDVDAVLHVPSTDDGVILNVEQTQIDNVSEFISDVREEAECEAKAEDEGGSVLKQDKLVVESSTSKMLNNENSDHGTEVLGASERSGDSKINATSLCTEGVEDKVEVGNGGGVEAETNVNIDHTASVDDMTLPILSPLPVGGHCIWPNPAIPPRPGFEMPNLTYYVQVPSHSRSTTPTPFPLNDETDEVGPSASTSGDMHPPERVVSPAPTTSGSGLGKSKQLPPRTRTNTGRLIGPRERKPTPTGSRPPSRKTSVDHSALVNSPPASTSGSGTVPVPTSASSSVVSATTSPMVQNSPLVSPPMTPGAFSSASNPTSSPSSHAQTFGVHSHSSSPYSSVRASTSTSYSYSSYSSSSGGGDIRSRPTSDSSGHRHFRMGSFNLSADGHEQEQEQQEQGEQPPSYSQSMQQPTTVALPILVNPFVSHATVQSVNLTGVESVQVGVSVSAPTAPPTVQTLTVSSGSSAPPLALGPVPIRRPSRGAAGASSSVRGAILEVVSEESPVIGVTAPTIAHGRTENNVSSTDRDSEAMVNGAGSDMMTATVMMAPLSPPPETRLSSSSLSRSQNASPIPHSPRTRTQQQQQQQLQSQSRQFHSSTSSSPIHSVPPTPLPSFQPLPPPTPLHLSIEPPTLPSTLRPLTLAAAHWSLSSAQLQSIVSRAIRASAEPSAVRLLPLEVLDGELSGLIRKVEDERAALCARIRWEVGRRAMLVQGLNALAWTGVGGSSGPGGGPASAAISPLTQLTHSLHTSTTTLDDLFCQLHSLTLQLNSLRSLQATHHASALAIALRKLHGSLGKRAKEGNELKRRVEELEAERNEAWRVAEDMAKEVDELTLKERERRRKAGEPEDSDEEEGGEGDWEDVSVDDEAEMVNITGRAVAAPALLTRASRIGRLELEGVDVPTIQLHVPQNILRQRPKSYSGETSPSSLSVPVVRSKVEEVKAARVEAVKAARGQSGSSSVPEVVVDEEVLKAASVPLPLMSEGELRDLEFRVEVEDGLVRNTGVGVGVEPQSSRTLSRIDTATLPSKSQLQSQSLASPRHLETAPLSSISAATNTSDNVNTSTRPTPAPTPPPKDRPYETAPSSSQVHSHAHTPSFPSLPPPPPPYSTSPISPAVPQVPPAIPPTQQRQRTNSVSSIRSGRSVRSTKSTKSTKSATSRVTAARTRSMRASKASLRMPSGGSGSGGNVSGRSGSGSGSASPLDASILAGVAAGFAGENMGAFNVGGGGGSSDVPEVPRIPRPYVNVNGSLSPSQGARDTRLSLVIPRMPMHPFLQTTPNSGSNGASASTTASTSVSPSAWRSPKPSTSPRRQPLPPIPLTLPIKIPSVQLPTTDGLTDSFLDMMTRPNSAVDSEDAASGILTIGLTRSKGKGVDGREAEENGKVTSRSVEASMGSGVGNGVGSIGMSTEIKRDSNGAQIVTIPDFERMLPFSASFAEELSRRLPLPPPSPNGAPRSPIRPFSAKLAPPSQALPQGVGSDGIDEEEGLEAFMDGNGRWSNRVRHRYGGSGVANGPFGAYAMPSQSTSIHAQIGYQARTRALENVDERDAFSALNDFADAYTCGYISTSPTKSIGSGSGSRSQTQSLLPLPRKGSNSRLGADSGTEPSPTRSRNSAIPALGTHSPLSTQATPASPIHSNSPTQSYRPQHSRNPGSLNSITSISESSNAVSSPVSPRGETTASTNIASQQQSSAPMSNANTNVAPTATPRKRTKRTFKFGALRRPSSMPTAADPTTEGSGDGGSNTNFVNTKAEESDSASGGVSRKIWRHF